MRLDRLTVQALGALLVVVSAAGPASAGGTAEATSMVRSPVNRTAWAAGRAAHGPRATAAQAVSAYWTTARMRGAHRAVTTPHGEGAAARGASGEGRRDGAVAQHAVRPAAAAGRVLWAATDPRFGPAAAGARTQGKVFFTMDGLDYVCSGTVVNSEGRATVWTAGHCVHGGAGGRWARNWTFVPGYDTDLADPRPYGTWTSTQLWTMTSWMQGSDFSSDMGVAVMEPQFGYEIVDYLGGQGIRTGVSKKSAERAFGYPAETPYDGGDLMTCQGTAAPEWSYGFWSAQTLKLPCDLTRGASGGGWMYAWDGSQGYLNGVNSRVDRADSPTLMYSPYFDDTAWALYSATRYL